MITANELRIGNLVLGPKGTMYNGEITSWNIGEFIKCNEYCDFIQGFRPIELTEEWLVKFGFEWCHEACGYFDKHHAVYFWESGEVEVHPFCTNDKDCQIFIKHVHQLQNLYFALTGEELTLSE